MDKSMTKWWQERVVYQIYPRSFEDTNGDGIGDIPGIIARLDHLKALGVGILWLSPVYLSPDVDNGYDISDYRVINPKFGTMGDMERLFEAAAQLDIKIIMDLVINHTSDQHMWFQKSRAGEEPYKDYYIWRPGRPGGRPPNNWTGFFMGDTWTYDEKRGAYYLHLFHQKQPDLNFHNPQVIQEVKDIMTFWLNKGAAGFRCDVINIIYKTALADGKPRLITRGLEHYKSQEGNHQILQALRREVLDHYDCFTVGETVMVDLAEAKRLSDGDRRELDMVFYFDHLEVDRRVARYIPKRFKAKRLLAVLTKWQQGLDWNAVYFENHDQPRIVSHYGNDGPYWAQSAKLLATLQFTLRGTPFIYQGQEIGMTNGDFASLSDIKDVESHNIDKLMQKLHVPKALRWQWIKPSSRDNARTPMQWTGEPGAGFTTGTPWLGINPNHRHINVSAQQTDPESVLHYYRRLIALRAASTTLKVGAFAPVYAKGGVIAYTRTQGVEQILVLLNFATRRAKAPFAGDVVITNTGRKTYDGSLGPYEAVVLRRMLGEVKG